MYPYGGPQGGMPPPGSPGGPMPMDGSYNYVPYMPGGYAPGYPPYPPYNPPPTQGGGIGAILAAAALCLCFVCPFLSWCVSGSREEFDCYKDYDRWRVSWSLDQMDYCCDKYNRGCVDVAPTPAPVYDCAAGIDAWKLGWSEDKQTWCCVNENKGCTTPAPYDCKAGDRWWKQEWSSSKQEFCCKW